MARIFILSQAGDDGEELRNLIGQAAPEHPVLLLDRSTLKGKDPLTRLGELLGNESTPGQEGSHSTHPMLMGQSTVARTLLAQLESLAQSEDPVLVLGEAGSGKAWLARAIHDRGPRSKGAFVSVNCASLTENLLYAELFGHQAGAFTGAVRNRPGKAQQADGGTLYLDAVDQLAPASAEAVATLIATGTITPAGAAEPLALDVRVVAAADVRNEEDVPAFAHPELAQRLNARRLYAPALRERREDIRFIAPHIVATAAARSGRSAPVLTDGALLGLESHDYPGNLRELESILERALLNRHGAEIERNDLPLPGRKASAPSLSQKTPELAGAWVNLQRQSRCSERELLQRARAEHPSLPLKDLAELLGTSERVLQLRFLEHGLPVP